TARCFNKSKGVLITGLKLKAFRNPQPSWGFSVHKKSGREDLHRLSLLDATLPCRIRYKADYFLISYSGV
ncbi:hypothetical protein ACFYKY_10280, partial [Escherichia coli]|uniref:hypothetical protein n=6 Tax=Escherichia coli TaxID=562 RepID=UPI0025416C64